MTPPASRPRCLLALVLGASILPSGTRVVLEANSRKDYRESLEKELKAISESEMWVAGAWVRSLRPEHIDNKAK